MFRPSPFQLAGRPRPGARLALVAAAFVSLLAGAPQADSQERNPQGEETPRYTDEDLRRLHPRPAAPVGTQAGEQPQTQPQTRPQTDLAPAAGTPPSRRTGAQTGPASPGAQAVPPGDPDWDKRWKQDQERRQFWEGRIRAAEGRIAEIEQRIEYLQRKKASIQNPFLPRPTLSEEDRREEEGMDAQTRLGRVDEQLSRARLDLEQARRALEEARAQAAEALAPPAPGDQSKPTY